MKICVFGPNARVCCSYSCLPLRASDIVRDQRSYTAPSAAITAHTFSLWNISGPFFWVRFQIHWKLTFYCATRPLILTINVNYGDYLKRGKLNPKSATHNQTDYTHIFLGRHAGLYFHDTLKFCPKENRSGFLLMLWNQNLTRRVCEQSSSKKMLSDLLFTAPVFKPHCFWCCCRHFYPDTRAITV